MGRGPNPNHAVVWIVAKDYEFDRDRERWCRFGSGPGRIVACRSTCGAQLPRQPPLNLSWCGHATKAHSPPTQDTRRKSDKIIYWGTQNPSRSHSDSCLAIADLLNLFGLGCGSTAPFHEVPASFCGPGRSPAERERECKDPPLIGDNSSSSDPGKDLAWTLLPLYSSHPAPGSRFCPPPLPSTQSVASGLGHTSGRSAAQQASDGSPSYTPF